MMKRWGWETPGVGRQTHAGARGDAGLGCVEWEQKHAMVLDSLKQEVSKGKGVGK